MKRITPQNSDPTNENNKQSGMAQVSVLVVLHNCTIDVDERQNNSQHHKEEKKGCTINNK